MTIFLRVLAAAAKYGTRMVKWVNNNRTRIMGWVRDGLAADAIIARIKQILGIK